MSGGPRSSETCSRDAGKECDPRAGNRADRKECNPRADNLGDSSKSNHGVLNAELDRNTRKEGLRKEDLEGLEGLRKEDLKEGKGAAREAATVSTIIANVFN